MFTLISGLVGLVIVALALVFFLGPFFWIVTTSLKGNEDFFAFPPVWIPADPSLAHADHAVVQAAAATLLDRRLEAVTRQTPAFAQALRAYDAALIRQDLATADALAAWLGGQPNVAATARRGAGIRGDLDHFGAMGFIQGLLVVLQDSGHPGLVLVLDEVETLQRIQETLLLEAPFF